MVLKEPILTHYGVKGMQWGKRKNDYLRFGLSKLKQTADKVKKTVSELSNKNQSDEKKTIASKVQTISAEKLKSLQKEFGLANIRFSTKSGTYINQETGEEYVLESNAIPQIRMSDSMPVKVDGGKQIVETKLQNFMNEAFKKRR